MAKATSQFVCSECGYISPKWLGRCTECGKYGSMIEESIAPSPTAKNSPRPFRGTKALPISQVSYDAEKRTPSGIEAFDDVLGGGIVKGSLILIGGDPGVGKSTLLTQIAAHLSLEHKVLYVSAEESCSQVKMRCKRLGLECSSLMLLNETNMEDIEASISDEEFVVIDSIQAVYTESLSSSSGSVGQVRECAGRLMRIAKSRGITFFIIGHVTKEGTLAGPKVLEHIMDAVIYFEGENADSFRMIRAVKNRFGSVQEVGVFQMGENGLTGVRDYSGIFLSDTRGIAAGSSVTPSETGNRCMVVEIQTLTARTAYGLPRRMSLGIDYNKLVVLLAVMEKRCGVQFATQDVYVNAMGGIRLSEPSVDLAICAALASAFYDEPIDKYTAFFGEVGLTGEVRAVSFADKRVNECVKMGFKRVVLPAKNIKSCEKFKDKIELISVSYVSQMTKLLRGDKK